MIVYIASDHAGYFIKEFVKKDLENRGFLVKDFSNPVYDVNDDYPDYIIPCIKKFIEDTNGNTDKGKCLIFGGSGNGEAICANRFKNARAFLCNNENLELVKLSRAHNNCNIISFGARFVSEQFTKVAIETFFITPFEAGRHVKRVLKIDYNL